MRRADRPATASDGGTADVDRVQRVRRPATRRDDEPSLGAPTRRRGRADEQGRDQGGDRAYDRALVTVNRKQEVTPQLEAVTTEAWAEQLLTTYDDNLFSNGLQMVGRWRTRSSR